VNKELFIQTGSEGLVIALTEDKRLTEIAKESTSRQFAVGDIYLAKVKKIHFPLNAAFIDLGYEKDAFLHYPDLGGQFNSLNNFLQRNLHTKQRIPLSSIDLKENINKDGHIKDILIPGQKIVVQVTKEPISSKGPRLTSEITIAGRNLVLIPFSNKISVSQKIESDEEKKRLQNIIKAIKPRNYGVIVRTVAQEKTAADFDAELRLLIDKWENSFSSVNINTKVPYKLIGEIDRTYSIIRDMLNDSFTNIVVDNYEVYNDMKEYIRSIAPEKEKILQLHKGPEPIFKKFDIEKQISGSFGQVVTLKTGAYLIIEKTEALHVIDVNSGNRSIKGQNQETNALEVNLLATDEIARQLRLRDMGGIIVVDFIDMHEAEHRKQVYDRMKELLAKDSAKSYVLQLSRFNVMEITRQRVRPEVKFKIEETCPVCNGTGKIAQSVLLVDQIKNDLEFIRNKYPTEKQFTIQTHPYVAAYITKGLLKSLKKQWQKEYRCKLQVLENNNYNFLEYHFFNTKEEQLL